MFIRSDFIRRQCPSGRGERACGIQQTADSLRERQKEKQQPIRAATFARIPPLLRKDGAPAESGQVLISLLLMMALFLLAIVGFSVDLTNLWFHRQAAQSAADSACQAGALDMSAVVAGLTLSNMGFTPGTAGNCSANSGAGTICFYAKTNGYNGSGLTSGASNSVAWSFPSSVPGATAPPSSITSYPFLNVTVTENVATHFLFNSSGSRYQKVVASCTCGLVQEKEAAPMIVLNPNAQGVFNSSGGASFNIVGGPQRSLQINSTNSTALTCSGGAIINTSKGGPNSTGSDVGIVGGPTTAPSCSGGGFHGGSTGQWHGDVLPIGDPYAGVGPPTSIKSIAPASGTSGTSVAKATSLSKAGADGCPDTSANCLEFSPGYYPNGISGSGGKTLIFLPGIYYMGNSLNASGGATLRMATPCTPSCSPLSASKGQQTDGIMFYFSSGSINLSGGSGGTTSLIPVSSTAFTCDGSAPNSSLGMPSSLNGNLLWAQCTNNGTYWDVGGDTTDSRGSPGTRGLLVYQAHTDTTGLNMSGGSNMSFSGALYMHSSSYGTVLNLSGGATNGTYILGMIVTDKVNLSGSGAINLALNPAPSTELLKVGMLQ